MKDDAMFQDARLHELAQRLGAHAAERLDVEATARAVVERLRETPRRTAAAWIWMRPAWLKIAAVLAVLAGAAIVTRVLLREPAPTDAAVTGVGVGDDLSDLSPAQLRETMGVLEQPPAGESMRALDTGLEGLSTQELRALLRTLEG